MLGAGVLPGSGASFASPGNETVYQSAMLGKGSDLAGLNPPPQQAAPIRSLTTFDPAMAPNPGTPATGDFRSGVVLVKLKPLVRWDALEPAVLGIQATRVDTIRGLDIHILAVPAGKEMEITAKLGSLPIVQYAEPDYVLRLQAEHVPAPLSALRAPSLVAPLHGSVSTSFSIPLAWASPADSQVVHLQVVPANNDGPGVDLIQVDANGFTIPPPPQWYGLLPDMTYTWRVRANESASWDANDPGWSPWSESWSFRTPVVFNTTIAPLSPAMNTAVQTTTPALTWSNPDSNVFYYEVQASADSTFNTNPATATAAVYSALIHGGVTSPANSYSVPANYPLSLRTTYFWRVRPRVQGDGTPLNWSPTWSFSVGVSGSATPVATPNPTLVPPPTALKPPNDPYYPLQWSLKKINAQAAWSVSAGSPSIVVAVVDSGVDLGHPDLAGQLVPGFNCVDAGSPPQDDHGHGTHVAGTIGAKANNAAGVVGVAWGAKIMPVKTIDRSGSGSSSCIADGIRFAVDNAAKIINLSLGSKYPSQAVEDAVNYAHDKGALVVASAGNCGDPGACDTLSPPNYPAAFSNVLAVAATGPKDERAVYSSYGWWVGVAAPGGNGGYLADSILSTCWRESPKCTFGQYTLSNGTSMAAPHVAGLAALVWSLKPSLTNDQVAQVIQSTSVDLGSPGRDDQFGAGRIDALAAARAVAGPGAIPPTPTPTPTPPPAPTPTPAPLLRFGDVRFGSRAPAPGTCVPGDLNVVFPGNSTIVFYGVEYQGSGAYQRRLYYNGQLVISGDLYESTPSSCVRSYFYATAGSTIRPGKYTLELWVREQLSSSGSFTILALPTPTATATPPAIPTATSTRTPTRTPTPVPLSVGNITFGLSPDSASGCRLAGVGTDFIKGPNRIYFRFDYSGSGTIYTTWYKDGTRITEPSGPYLEFGPSGCEWGFLYTADGTPMSPGSYRLDITSQHAVVQTGSFTIRAEATATPSPTRTSTSIPTVVPSPTPTQAVGPSPTPTQAVSPTPTIGVTSTPTPTPTQAVSPTPTVTGTPSPTATPTRTPTRTPTPPTPTPPTPSATTSCSWTGTWSTSYNTMRLTQSGSAVTGTYEYNSGRITGTASGATLSGRWDEGAESPGGDGGFIWTISADCNAFSGTWGSAGSSSTGGGWSGTRTSTTVPTPVATATPTPAVTGLSFGSITFGTLYTGGSTCQLGGVASTFPSGISEVIARFDYTGSGTYSGSAYRNGAPFGTAGPYSLPGPAGCDAMSFGNAAGPPLATGVYRLDLKVGTTIVRSGSFSVQ